MPTGVLSSLGEGRGPAEVTLPTVGIWPNEKDEGEGERVKAAEWLPDEHGDPAWLRGQEVQRLWAIGGQWGHWLAGPGGAAGCVEWGPQEDSGAGTLVTRNVRDCGHW